ncbi:sulfite exporter TauE/SafE family protein [Cohnella zeiphila]|uniref:Probable membrane transporter protein n=1 Tax=Cohnella zeiphila TaxID=2761120 RepID=A0A7X0VUQ2_9BACL|nr:sulfite exporter TauE/SafE family protein [Cohnella zeiphila]MBB6730645.1 sulfite exporter TauE/SafE family protein [Cohnella zeiphila]
MQLDGLDIVIGIATGLMIGFSKTGVPSSGIFAVTLMAMIFPAKDSVGIILPMLITGDIIAVAYYRRKVIWKYLIVLIPWVLIGVVAGYFFLEVVNDRQLKLTIGCLVLALIVLHLVRERFGAKLGVPSWLARWLNPFLGALAGFATMIGNAAGGVMSIYLLGKKLPKEVFVGTGAWFFFLINLLKVPFSVQLGMITRDSLIFNAWMIVPIAAGSWIGIRVLAKLSDRWFQYSVLALSAAGSIKLIFF